jgi:hypothetical protein
MRDRGAAGKISAMKRFCRWTSNGAATLSLLLCALAVTFSVCEYPHGDTVILECRGVNVGMTQENLFYSGPPYKRQAHLGYDGATTALSTEVWADPSIYLFPFWKIAIVFAILPTIWGLQHLISKKKKVFSN